MRIRVTNRWDWHYESAVSFSPHIFRLFPKVDRFVNVLNAKFTTNADADVQYRRDLFDNEVAYCFYPEKGTPAEIRRCPPPGAGITGAEPLPFPARFARALDFPFQYKPDGGLCALRPFLGTRNRPPPNASRVAPVLATWRKTARLESALDGTQRVIRKNYQIRRASR